MGQAMELQGRRVPHSARAGVGAVWDGRGAGSVVVVSRGRGWGRGSRRWGQAGAQGQA